MAKEKSGNTTRTQLVENAIRDPEACKVFIESYIKFLTAILRTGCIFAGRRVCTISAPPFGNMGPIICELEDLMEEVCIEFLNKKVTPEFIEAIRKTHRGEAEPHNHFSVRTTLQYMFVQKLKEKHPGSLIVRFNGNDIEIYLRKDSGKPTTGTEPLPPPPAPPPKEEIRELLRLFRCLLTRQAGKGNTAVYPTPYECYCLYHDCFGTDRKKIVQEYAPDAEEQEKQKFLNKENWNDAVVGSLLEHRYHGQRQTSNNRRISCDRKTINNRRREYQERLSKCILHFLPDAKPEVIRQILDKRDVDDRTVNDFCTDFIASTGMQRGEAADQLRTRTLEKRK